SEVIREALRLFETYQAVQAASFSALKADIAQGVADVHAGRVSAMDMAAIKAQGRAALRSKTGSD
ncbi:MAG: CopG family transcriptional regulator, partial [Acidovorax sp. 32-64-7]